MAKTARRLTRWPEHDRELSRRSDNLPDVKRTGSVRDPAVDVLADHRNVTSQSVGLVLHHGGHLPDPVVRECRHLFSVTAENRSTLPLYAVLG